MSAKVPRFAVDRLIDLSALAELRRQSSTRISWSTLFLKAYARVSAQTPLLRRCYVAWPWPRLVELADTVGVMAISRRDEEHGEDCLCWPRFKSPESRSLVELQSALEYYQREPIAVAFKRQVAASRTPGWLRRVIGWFNMEVCLRRRADRLGTFSMSTLAGQQAWNRSHPSFLTTSLSFGPLDEQGRSLVTLLCDHRVVDGLPAARALEQLEIELNGPIAEELKELAQLRLAKAV